MSLTRVEITQGVLLTCMTHAMTTESEEIMGLLLGDIKVEPSGAVVSHIWMAYPQIRTDRRKDRVETSPEQMARCSAHAERLSQQTGLRTRVVGWYHSHPHITVLPSHVDVRTQAMYQMLDPGFVGLIFSVFNTDSASHAGQVQVTAFQSVPANHPDAAHGGGARGLGAGELVSYSSEALAGLDTPTKQALRASADDMRKQDSSALARREVPLTVVAPRNPSEASLQDLVTVQHILALEEKQAYKAASGGGATSGGSPVSSAEASSGRGAGQEQDTRFSSPGQALLQLHAAGVYQQGLTQMLDTTVAAALVGMRALATQQAVQTEQLLATNAALKEELGRLQQAQQQRQQQQRTLSHVRTHPQDNTGSPVPDPNRFMGHNSSSTSRPLTPRSAPSPTEAVVAGSPGQSPTAFPHPHQQPHMPTPQQQPAPADPTIPDYVQEQQQRLQQLQLQHQELLRSVSRGSTQSPVSTTPQAPVSPPAASAQGQQSVFEAYQQQPAHTAHPAPGGMDGATGQWQQAHLYGPQYANMGGLPQFSRVEQQRRQGQSPDEGHSTGQWTR